MENMIICQVVSKIPSILSTNDATRVTQNLPSPSEALNRIVPGRTSRGTVDGFPRAPPRREGASK